MGAALQRLGTRLRELVGEEVGRSAPRTERWKVKKATPLILESPTDSDLFLEDGDPDFEIEQHVRDADPAVGDMVTVHADDDGYIARGVVKD